MKTGDVGIFWFLDGDLIQDSVPCTDGEEYGDFINGKNSHYDYWESLRRRQPRLRQYEYDEVPRGRVVYSKRDGKFHIYGSEQFVQNTAEKDIVLCAFNIPREKAVFQSDEHYSLTPPRLGDDSEDDS